MYGQQNIIYLGNLMDLQNNIVENRKFIIFRHFIIPMDSKTYTCICNKSYTCRQNLFRHRQKCTVQPAQIQEHVMLQPAIEQCVKQEPVKQEPVKQEPVKQEPVIQQAENKPFCLNDYLSTLLPLSIDFYKCKYTPTIKDFNNVLVNGISNGVYRNITEYFDTYEWQQMPIVVTNPQSARFKMMVYTNNQWVHY